MGETLQHTFSGIHEARNLFCTFLITLNRHHLCIWYQVLLIDLCVMSRAWLIYWLADIVGRCQPFTHTLVSAYRLSDMCWYVNVFVRDDTFLITREIYCFRNLAPKINIGQARVCGPLVEGQALWNWNSKALEIFSRLLKVKCNVALRSRGWDNYLETKMLRYRNRYDVIKHVSSILVK